MVLIIKCEGWPEEGLYIWVERMISGEEKIRKAKGVVKIIYFNVQPQRRCPERYWRQ